MTRQQLWKRMLRRFGFALGAVDCLVQIDCQSRQPPRRFLRDPPVLRSRPHAMAVHPAGRMTAGARHSKVHSCLDYTVHLHVPSCSCSSVDV